ncbi:MAG: phosphate ABC transporter, permease protein PstA, partial [Moorea sp. SIO3I7]|nr:phosphate ABC transporter, permease protein PstA [Moorena sp. SIO3I7]
MAQDLKPLGDDSLGNFNLALTKRYNFDKIFAIAAWVGICFGLAILAVLLIDVFLDGLPRLDWQFITS